MWPKVFAQLIELLPHASRLMPMAEKFFTSRSADDMAQHKALSAMAEGVRGDLGQVTAAHSGLYRQLQDQSAAIDLIAVEARAARAAAEESTSRIALLESRIKTVFGLLIFCAVMLVVVLLFVVRGQMR